jgi:hypothetical protein
MTALVVDRPQRRTEAFPPAVGSLLTKTGQPASWSSQDSVTLTLIPAEERFIISGGELAARLMLESYFLLGSDPATSSMPPPIVRSSPYRHATNQPTPALRTAAQEAITKIHAISKLTNEEIAPLAGVSRRSIQAWVAGGQISARKEQRLRALRAAIQAIAAPDPQVTRRRLFDHTPGDVCAYDLLAEGHFKEAVDLALGRRAAVTMPAAPQAQNLAAQLDHHEGHIDLRPERINRRFSGRLMR